MSGKRQHFIPRFLLDGFASHKIGDESYIWVYRKANPPFNTNIINAGVEGHFYTHGNDTLVDDMITEAEGPLSSLLENLRQSSTANISDSHLPFLIAHLEVRTRHFRQNILQAFDVLTARMIDFIADEEAFIDYWKRKYKQDPSMMNKALAKELAARGLNRQKIRETMRKSKSTVYSTMNELKPMLSAMAKEMRSTLPTKLKLLAKENHIKALKEAVAPEPRIQRYKDLSYAVREIPEGNLILGDSIVFFNVEGPKPFKSILTNDNDVMKAVFLPISPHKVLVGANDLTCVQHANLRQAIARCSLEYFVAHIDSSENHEIGAQIGEDAEIFSKQEIEETLDEIINR